MGIPGLAYWSRAGLPWPSTPGAFPLLLRCPPLRHHSLCRPQVFSKIFLFKTFLFPLSLSFLRVSGGCCLYLLVKGAASTKKTRPK